MSHLISTLNDKQDNLKDVLESLVDKHGVSYLVSTLAQVCYAKSDHLSSNWQDGEGAKSWEIIGELLDSLEEEISNPGI